jgi:glycosyltransferase involved in cell wall biosynthesis
MRVLYVVEAFGGGVFELVSTVAAGVAARGHDVLIAHGRRPETPSAVPEHVDSRVEVRAMPWTERTLGAQLTGMRGLRRLVREWKPDVAHLYSAFAGFEGAVVLRRSVPTLFTPQAYAFSMHGLGSPRRLAYRTAERFASRRALAVGACSEDEARLARELGARRVEVVANGIPELDTEPPERPDRDGSVVALGRTVPQRQPVACARILSAVSSAADVAWVGGAGGRRGEAGFRALRRAGVPVTGWEPRASVLEVLSNATAYLHWTGWDGLPLSVLEAMAMDAVVVASDIGPNRELLGQGQVCTTEEEAVAMLQRVVADPSFADELRASQRARRRGYGADRMVDEWLDLYGRLVG